jgi:hypothetical protein
VSLKGKEEKCNCNVMICTETSMVIRSGFVTNTSNARPCKGHSGKCRPESKHQISIEYLRDPRGLTCCVYVGREGITNEKEYKDCRYFGGVT